MRAAVEAAKARAPHPLRIEVEVTNLGELDEALAAGAEIVLLDNMTPAQVEVAAARAHGRNVLVEVSGGITLATIADYARAGADLDLGRRAHPLGARGRHRPGRAHVTAQPAYLIPPLARWLGSHRIDLDECGSTNDEAARLARAGASHGTVVIAERQRAGRGRDGRPWASPPGLGLYLSAVLRPPLPLVDVPPMTLAIGIGLCDAVRATGVPRVPQVAQRRAGRRQEARGRARRGAEPGRHASRR